MSAFPQTHRARPVSATHAAPATAGERLALPGIPYNLQRERLGACIDRIRERFENAARELRIAERLNKDSRALICEGGPWCAMDAIWADDFFVREYEQRLDWERRRLWHHEALFRILFNAEWRAA